MATNCIRNDVGYVRIVALYKTFEGEEFLASSIESIYKHCAKIVFVNSEISWNGDKGNTCVPVINDWKDKHDEQNKIININGIYSDQLTQYMAGINYIKQNIPCDYILIIDTDEVWDEENLKKAINILNIDRGNHIAYTCNMHTYVKSPFYRVEPSEPCKPVVFVHAGITDFAGVRGSRIPNKYLMQDVFMHHFCYVRKDDEIIFRKYRTSEIGDKQASHNVNDWIENKWKKIPYVEDFHPTKRYEYCWHRTRIITESELPQTVIGKEIMNRWK